MPAKGGLSGWRLRIVLEYLDENFAENVSSAELAGLAGLSHRHFCTAFRRSVGVPPHRYVVERRIVRSKGLLADPALSVTDVAMAVGFGAPKPSSSMARSRAPSAVSAEGHVPSSRRSTSGTAGAARFEGWVPRPRVMPSTTIARPGWRVLAAPPNKAE